MPTRDTSDGEPVSYTHLRIGGTGGGNLEIGFDVTYGGTRTLGKVTNSSGNITFAPDEE